MNQRTSKYLDLEFPEFVDTEVWKFLPLKVRIILALEEDILLPQFYEKLLSQSRNIRSRRISTFFRKLRIPLRERLELARALDH